jgi:hypothetical protein
MKTIRPVTDARAAPFGPVKSGDRVSLHLRDGRTETCIVQRVDGEHLVSTTGHSYARSDIVELKRRSTSSWKTTLLITGIAVTGFFVLAAAAFASGGIPVM